MSKKKQVIVYGHPLFESSTGKDIDWHVNSMCITSFDVVNLSLQKGNRVEQITMTIERAEQIGLINWDALQEYMESK